MCDYSLKPLTHHDALEFSDGQIVLLTDLFEHQEATVLQLPAQSVTAAEAKGPGTGRVHRLISLARACRPPSIGRPVLRPCQISAN